MKRIDCILYAIAAVLIAISLFGCSESEFMLLHMTVTEPETYLDESGIRTVLISSKEYPYMKVEISTQYEIRTGDKIHVVVPYDELNVESILYGYLLQID